MWETNGKRGGGGGGKAKDRLAQLPLKYTGLIGKANQGIDVIVLKILIFSLLCIEGIFSLLFFFFFGPVYRRNLKGKNSSINLYFSFYQSYPYFFPFLFNPNQDRWNRS